MGTVTTLERAVYGLGQAASLLGLRSDRVRAWLDGYSRKGVWYDPVIRPERTGSDIVTWGEFIELGYLREYRHAGVSLQSMRPVIAQLREENQTLYPLASADLYVHGRELVARLQEELDLPAELFMVVRTREVGFELARNASAFFRKVEFSDHGTAARWRPAGPQSPVAIEPDVSFGMPSVSGTSTERLFELWSAEGGDEASARWLADVYELEPAVVDAAIAFEEHQRSLTAA
jgi:hypothetical protein